jgi:hypothetical protein
MTAHVPSPSATTTATLTTREDSTETERSETATLSVPTIDLKSSTEINGSVVVEQIKTISNMDVVATKVFKEANQRALLQHRFMLERNKQMAVMEEVTIDIVSTEKSSGKCCCRLTCQMLVVNISSTI